MVWALAAGLGVATADEARTFLHIEGPETTLDLPWDAVDAAWLDELGLKADADRLQSRAEALRGAGIGARRRVRIRVEAGEVRVATLERRPDARLSEADVAAWLAACADADPGA